MSTSRKKIKSTSTKKIQQQLFIFDANKLEHLTRTVDATIDKGRVHYNRGMCYLELSFYKEALEDFNNAIYHFGKKHEFVPTILKRCIQACVERHDPSGKLKYTNMLRKLTSASISIVDLPREKKIIAIRDLLQEIISALPEVKNQTSIRSILKCSLKDIKHAFYSLSESERARIANELMDESTLLGSLYREKYSAKYIERIQVVHNEYKLKTHGLDALFLPNDPADTNRILSMEKKPAQHPMEAELADDMVLQISCGLNFC